MTVLPGPGGHRSSATASRSGAAVIASLVAFAGCASGGPSPGEVGPASAVMAAQDSARVADVNRRIMSATPTPGSGEPSTFEGYRVGANDLIRVDVFGAETFSGEYRVEDSGAIAFPLLGSIEASGRTPRELESLLEERLRESYMRDPHVAIQVLEVQSQGVSVIGAVQSPGVYQIRGRSTLLEVLAMAQGLTETAGTEVFVVRAAAASPSATTSEAGGSGVTSHASIPGDSLAAMGLEDAAMDGGEILEVDLDALLESGRTAQNIEVLPGDIVQVRPAGLVYVVGEVNRPGGFSMPAGARMSALQAVAMAEGLSRTALASGAVIVRQLEDGNRAEIPVNLEAVLEGETPPPVLEAQDVLFVPNNRSKAFALGVVNALVSMVTFRGLFY